MTNFAIYPKEIFKGIIKQLFVGMAFYIFYKVLRKYGSTNLMNARV